MRSVADRLIGTAAVLVTLASTAAAQEKPLRPYAHGGVGIGRLVFLCPGCGDEQTAVVPLASVGLSFTRAGVDVGLSALGWTHIGDRYTVITIGTTLRPRRVPFFIGGGVGLAVRQYPGVCSSCSGASGTPVRIRSATTDAAAMVQFGARIPAGYRVGLEPFVQLSRLGRGALSVGHATHLAVGVRIDGR